MCNIFSFQHPPEVDVFLRFRSDLVLTVFGPLENDPSAAMASLRQLYQVAECDLVSLALLHHVG